MAKNKKGQNEPQQEVNLEQVVVQRLSNRISSLIVDLEISNTQRDYYQQQFQKVAQELEEYKVKEHEQNTVQEVDKPKQNKKPAAKKKGDK